MNKQDAIKNAYTEYFNVKKISNNISFEDLSNEIDNDGWLHSRPKYYDLDRDYFEVKSNGLTKVMSRPKCLKGIENNNGWIKLEKQDDLPLEDTEYFAINDDGEIDIYSIEELLDNLPYITHYQPIAKPISPIY
jgi:hypothetical protein